MVRQNEKWFQHALKTLELQRKVEEYKLLYKEHLEELKKLSSYKDSECNGITLTFSLRKGTIDYGSISILKDMDLDIYRKEPTVVWKLEVKQDE